MSLKKKYIPVLMMSLFLSLLGCSKAPDLSNLSRILYDQYHGNLLNVRFDHHHQLMVIYRFDLGHATPDSAKDVALHLAKTAFVNFPDTSKIDSVVIRFQSIGAPTIINEKNAGNFAFAKRDLK